MSLKPEMDPLEAICPKNQDPIQMAGYRACLLEALRFLKEEAQCDGSHPLVMALQQHLQLEQAAVEYEKLLNCLFEDQAEQKTVKRCIAQPGGNGATFAPQDSTIDGVENKENYQLESYDMEHESLEQMRQTLINAAYRGCDLHPHNPNLTLNTSLPSPGTVPRSPSR